MILVHHCQAPLLLVTTTSTDNYYRPIIDLTMFYKNINKNVYDNFNILALIVFNLFCFIK